MFRPAHQHRHSERLFVHEPLVKPSVLAQIKSLVGSIDNNRIFVKPRTLQIVENLAHAFVHTCHGSHVVLHITLVFPFSHFLKRTFLGIELIVAFTVGIQKTALFFRSHCTQKSMRPRVKQKFVAVDASHHLQVVAFVHVAVNVHFLHLGGITALIGIEIVVGQRELRMLIQTVMAFGRHPVAVHGLVVHHQEKRLAAFSLTVVQPFLAILRNEVGDIAHVLRRVVLRDEIRIAIVSLVIENHPMVETGRLGNQMPLSDNGRFIAVSLQHFRQSELRTVEPLVGILHESVFMAMLSCQHGSAARTGNGVAAIVVHKHGPFIANAVNVGSRSDFSDWIPVDAHCLAGMVVAHDKYNVRAFVTRLCRNRQQRQRTQSQG